MLCEKDKRRELLYSDLFLFVYLKSILKCVHFKKKQKKPERDPVWISWPWSATKAYNVHLMSHTSEKDIHKLQ